jgi:unsaturated chondroitin disaccharide hydrolase
MMPFNIQRAIQRALNTICANMATFGDLYPDDTTVGNIYSLRRAQNGFAEGENYGWTTGFWPGILWLAYELSDREIYLIHAQRHIQSFAKRLQEQIDLDTHDIGFLYTLTCVAPWRLTGNVYAKQTALQAATHLMTRYLPQAGIIQAWGKLGDPQQRGNTIVDSLMNTPLLYWASEATGERRFAEAAYRHARQVRDHLVRPDNTTYHTFYWDVTTGQPLRGSTAQGYTAESCWARGQAWAIYGFSLNYRYTSDATFLSTAQRCADYFLDHLPADRVPYWDLVFGDGSGEERDSSAAAIAVCGLQEMVRWLADDEQRRRYQTAADAILTSLVTRYAACHQPESNALLLHSVYDKPKATGVDEGCLWGDYFYLESLTRAANPDWALYW